MKLSKKRAAEILAAKREKKIAEQAQRIKELEGFVASVPDLNRLVDATLCSVSIKYGEEVKGEEGEVIGYRLNLPPFKVDELLDTYEIHSEKSEDGGYTVGAVKRIAEIA